LSFLITALAALVAAVLLLGTYLWRNLATIATLRADLAGTRCDLVRQLREAEHFRMACEHADDGIVIQTLDGIIVWPNPAYCRIMGRPPEEMIGRNPLEFALPSEDTPGADVIRAFRYNPEDPKFKKLQLFRNRRSNGELFWNQLSVSFRKSATGEDHVILVCRDVTAQIEQEERLREARNRLAREASHDGLTGLPNRNAFLKFTTQALRAAARHDGRVALLHVDLDNFKEINDTNGHAVGDVALKHVARALRSSLEKDEHVARIGGDEFVVISPHVRSMAALKALSDRVAQNIAAPFIHGNLTLRTGCSIGAALSEPGEKTPESLLLRSDFALYEAKRGGRNKVMTYDAVLYRRHTHRLHRATELAEAIDTGALIHVYQPTFDLVQGRVTGLETLVRWDHPEEGVIPPGDFLPLAFELGLMGELDLASMGSALRRKSILDQSGHGELCVAFNASAELLMHPDFINRLIWGVEAGGIARDTITIEVLETTAFGDMSGNTSCAAVIRDLRDAGFRVLLDDFGIGYAGLSHLARLAVTGVKVDRTLVGEILTDEPSRKIVRKIIELSIDLGLDVIAEGVETRQTAHALQEMGCQYIQGYWIARPLAEDQVLPFLARMGRGPADRAAAG